MRRSLIFHCYPKRGEDWRENCLATMRYRAIFNGRLLVSITSGNECDSPGTVVEWFSQFGSQLEYKIVRNDATKGLNTTFREQVKAVRNEDGIVFKAHTKGISYAGDPCRVWRENMARGCLGNIPLVERKFTEGYFTFATFKTTTNEGANVMGQLDPVFKDPWPGWHYPGAFYWFSPRYVPERVFELPIHHYENEAFTSHMGPSETGFSLTPDNISFWEHLWLT